MGAPTISPAARNTFWFPCHAVDRFGKLYYIDGITRGLVWDAQWSTMMKIGIDKALAPVITEDTASGSLTNGGTYYCGIRYLDKNLQPGDLSEFDDEAIGSATSRLDWAFNASTDPRIAYVELWRSVASVSATVYLIIRLGNNGTLTSITNSPGSASLLSPTAHNLAIGATILVAGASVAGYNTTHRVTSVPDAFTVVTDQAYTSNATGGTWTITGYTDRDDDSDNDLIANNESMQILNTDGTFYARRFGVPPSYKSAMIIFQDRAIYGVDIEYSAGTVSGVAKATTLTGSGTDWPSDFVGRDVLITGQNDIFRITGWTNATTISIDKPLVGTVSAGTTYVIRSPREFLDTYIYCVDEDTEILTKRGWLKRSELVPILDETLTINPKTLETEWQAVDRVNQFAYTGMMSHWNSKQFHSVTTPGHRWLAAGCGMIGGHHSLREAWPNATHFTTTEECESKTSKRLVVATGKAVTQSGGAFEDEFVELVGWYLTEGSNSQDSCAVFVVQSESANPEKVARIRAIQEHYAATGATATEHDLHRADLMRQFYFGKGIGSRLRTACPGKQLTPAFLMALSTRQLRLLYQTMMAGDGHTKAVDLGGTEVFAQQDQGRIAGFQMLAGMLGLRTCARKSKHFDCSGVTTYKPRLTATTKLKQTQEFYNGIVWCPTTANGTWLARRKGYTFWTGNSESDEPESCPIDTVLGYVNTVKVQKNSSDIADKETGIMPLGGNFYSLRERHIYRINFTRQPDIDAAINLVGSRGALNNRCWAQLNEVAYLMDDVGCWMFAGSGGPKPISGPIQDLWRDGTIDMTNKKWFFVVADRQLEMIKFFVRRVGDAASAYPSVSYNYHVPTQNWHLETYPWDIGHACHALIGGTVRLLIGIENDQILKSNDGHQDLGIGIDWAWRSGQFEFLDDGEQNTRSIEVMFKPLPNAATMTAQVYIDQDTSPAMPHSDLNLGHNAVMVANTAGVTIDMYRFRDARGVWPGNAHWKIGGRLDQVNVSGHYVQVGLTGTQTADFVAIYSVTINGVEG